MKRLIILILGVLLLLLIGAGGYLIWQSLSKTPSTTIVTPPNSTDTTPIATTNPVTMLSNVPVVAYKVLPDKIIAIQTSGAVIEIQSGQVQTLNPSTIDSLISASISANGAKILAKFGNGDLPLFSVFDTATNAWTGIGFTISAAAWSPVTNDIAYLEKVNGISNIGVLSSDTPADPKKPEAGLKRTNLASFAEIDSELAWPNQNELLIYSKPTRGTVGYALKYKIKENEFSALPLVGAGTTILWNQDGSSGLRHSVTTKDTLALVDSMLTLQRDLVLMTLPEKCAFNGAYLYCNLPVFPPGTVIPDDYLKKALYLPGGFYRIDLTTGKTDIIQVSTPLQYDAKALSVSGNTVTFINNLNGLLYQFSFVAPN